MVKVKTRVAVRIKEAVNGKKSLNISADLTALTQRYNVMKKKITHFAIVLSKHHALIGELSKSHVNVASQITSLTQGTPMYSCGGDFENHSHSYSAIHNALSKKTEEFADKYNQFIVQYVLEWERVVTTRVNAGLKTTASLRLDLDHYQRKVEDLHLQVNRLLSKGKMVDEKTKDKLKRNGEKLTKSKQIHDKASRDMCMLLEETVDQGWKDLHPLLVKMAQFDMTVANDEAKGLSEMDSVVTALKGLATLNGLNPAGRLKALSAEKVSILYTGKTHNSAVGAISNGNEGFQSGGSAGMGQASSYMPYENNAPSLPPGSVAPQGMGGYPVQVAEISIPSLPPALPPGSVAPQGMGGYPVHVRSEDTPFNDLTTTANSSSNNHWNNTVPISTSDMLAVAQSAAPPPTLDEIDYANDQQFAAPFTNPFGPGSYMPTDLAGNSNDQLPSTNPFGPSGNITVAPAPFAPAAPSDGITIVAAPYAPPPPPPEDTPTGYPIMTSAACDPPSGPHSAITPRGSLNNPFDPPAGGVRRDPPSSSPSTDPFGY